MKIAESYRIPVNIDALRHKMTFEGRKYKWLANQVGLSLPNFYHYMSHPKGMPLPIAIRVANIMSMPDFIKDKTVNIHLLNYADTLRRRA